MERAEALASLVSTARSYWIHRSRTPSVRRLNITGIAMRAARHSGFWPALIILMGCAAHVSNPPAQSEHGARILGVLAFGRGVKDDDLFAINRAPLLDWPSLPDLPIPGARMDSPRTLGVIDSAYRPVLINLVGTSHPNTPVRVEVLEVGPENAAAKIGTKPAAGYCVGTDWSFAFYLHGIGTPPIAGTVQSRVGSSMH